MRCKQLHHEQHTRQTPMQTMHRLVSGLLPSALLWLLVMAISGCQKDVPHSYSDTTGERVDFSLAVEISTGEGHMKTNTPASVPEPDTRPLNELQMKGTHNSYHVAPSLVFHGSHAYTHPPLYEQLEAHNVRVFELDVHHNPFTNVFEVYHVPVIDPVSRCRLLKRCLDAFKRWSAHNPDHDPVFVWIEVKASASDGSMKQLDDLDQVLLTEMADHMLTPDQFKRHYATVKERIRQQGWPTVEEARGKFIFILLNADDYMERYTHAFQHIEGRAMFPRVHRRLFEANWAAFAKVSVDNREDLIRAQRAQLMTATNACLATMSKAACMDSIHAALAAGIHMIKTDDSAIDFQAVMALHALRDGSKRVRSRRGSGKETAPETSVSGNVSISRRRIR